MIIQMTYLRRMKWYDQQQTCEMLYDDIDGLHKKYEMFNENKDDLPQMCEMVYEDILVNDLYQTCEMIFEDIDDLPQTCEVFNDDKK